MLPIRLDHIAIALPRIAEAAAVLVPVLGGVPERRQSSRGLSTVRARGAVGGRTLAGLEAASSRLGIRFAQPFA